MFVMDDGTGVAERSLDPRVSGAQSNRRSDEVVITIETTAEIVGCT